LGTSSVKVLAAHDGILICTCCAMMHLSELACVLYRQIVLRLLTARAYAQSVEAGMWERMNGFFPFS